MNKDKFTKINKMCFLVGSVRNVYKDIKPKQKKEYFFPQFFSLVNELDCEDVQIMLERFRSVDFLELMPYGGVNPVSYKCEKEGNNLIVKVIVKKD